MFKGIVQSKMKMYSGSVHSRCKWVCFFIRTDLEKCSIASLAHQWILCSEWVPSEVESKQLKKTNFSKSWTNNLHLGLSEGEYIFSKCSFWLNYHFGWTISLKSCLSCRCWNGRRISDMHAFIFQKGCCYFDHVMHTRPLDCIKYHSSSLPEHIMSSLYSLWGRWADKHHPFHWRLTKGFSGPSRLTSPLT